MVIEAHHEFVMATNRAYVVAQLNVQQLSRMKYLGVFMRRSRRKLEMNFNDDTSKDVQPEVQSSSATGCLLYTSPSPRDGLLSRMPSSA